MRRSGQVRNAAFMRQRRILSCARPEAGECGECFYLDRLGLNFNLAGCRHHRVRGFFVNLPTATASEPLKTGLRHVTIFFSDLANFSAWTQKVGDVEASNIASQ